MSHRASSFAAFQRLMGNALIVWGSLSALAGAVSLLILRGEAARHAGIQAIVWGLIDALIGLLGRRGARQHGPVGPRARHLQRLLAINAIADIGYVMGGAWLMRSARGDGRKAGAGVGIVIQGAFLLLFDTFLTVFSRRWTHD